MCGDCWAEHGSPTIWNPEVAAVADLVTELYDDYGCTTGGPLHVYVDDWNLDIPTIEPYWSEDDDPALIAFVTALAQRLEALSVPERYSALAHHDGFARQGFAVASDSQGGRP